MSPLIVVDNVAGTIQMNRPMDETAIIQRGQANIADNRSAPHSASGLNCSLMSSVS